MIDNQIGVRVKNIRKVNKLTQVDFALSIEITQASLSQIENGTILPSLELVKRISDLYDISYNYIIDGIGYFEKGNEALIAQEDAEFDVNTSRKSYTVPVTQETNLKTNLKTNLTTGNVDFMPKVVTMDISGRETVLVVPIKARAGYLAGYGDQEYIETLPSYHLPGLGAGTWRDFEVKGLSMYPTLNDKDRVLTKFVETTKEIRDGRVYVVVHNEEGIIIKRLLNRIDKENCVICKSDNKVNHPNIVIEPTEILEIWEVKYLLTRHLDDPALVYERLNDIEAKVTLLEQGKLKK